MSSLSLTFSVKTVLLYRLSWIICASKRLCLVSSSLSQLRQILLKVGHITDLGLPIFYPFKSHMPGGHVTTQTVRSQQMFGDTLL